jgi:hypothetical protein
MKEDSVKMQNEYPTGRQEDKTKASIKNIVFKLGLKQCILLMQFGDSEGLPSSDGADPEASHTFVWGTNINIASISSRLRRFLTQFEEPGTSEPKYMALLRQVGGQGSIFHAHRRVAEMPGCSLGCSLLTLICHWELGPVGIMVPPGTCNSWVWCADV